MSNLVHLHVHSEYSLRDSVITIPKLLEHCKSQNMKSIAITDHGNLSGSMEFYISCLKEDIKPIIGVEMYIVKDSNEKNKDEKRRHIILLAKNPKGYKNLLKICTIAGTDGFYYVPRTDLDTMSKYCEGLICLTACAPSSVLYLYGKQEEKVIYMMKLLLEIFGDNIYLEVMPHNFKEQKIHNFLLWRLSKKYELPMVATQDSHYIVFQDIEVHEILMKIQERQPYSADTFYVSSRKDMEKLFDIQRCLPRSVFVEALDNTEVISSMVKPYNIPIECFEYPLFIIPKGDSNE